MAYPQPRRCRHLASARDGGEVWAIMHFGFFPQSFPIEPFATVMQRNPLSGHDPETFEYGFGAALRALHVEGPVVHQARAADVIASLIKTGAARLGFAPRAYRHN
jgi:hypothetical protein